jgi:D-alanyl-D-alanine carboxypeptidase
MSEAASGDGVILKPHSGYRSVSSQKEIYARIAGAKGEEYAARILKKPGESEHHTGLAIDIDDGASPECSLMPCFEKSAGFKWLKINARQFGFVLSYPRNNEQGIAYEPWHWRYLR